MSSWRGVIEEFREFLPVTSQTPVVTLSEGGTPLIACPALADFIGGDRRVFVKYEGLNPTASFKDRGMTVALSLALERGARTVICASTGNTSAAAAAYAARAGIQCVVILPANKISKGKLAQALIYGARVVAIDGNFDDALNLVRDLSREPGIAVVNSINPDRIEGQKTAAFEIIRTLGEAPDAHFLPVGNAGNITAYWKGYLEFHGLGRSQRLPRMVGFQAEGAAPLVRGEPVPHPETVATAIRIGNPASWKGAIRAVDESHGTLRTVSDAEILEAHRWLAAHEGIFVEPASAAGVAGLKQMAARPDLDAWLPPRGTVVCTVTGHGLKDPDTALANAPDPIAAPPTRDAILEIIRR